MTTSTIASGTYGVHRILRGLSRLRFSWALLLLLYVVAAWMGSLTHSIAGTDLLLRYGYGVAALRQGQLHTLLTSAAFALYPWMLATITLVILFFVVPYELVTGPWRAGLVFVVSQVGAFFLASVLVSWPLGALGSGWGHYLATTRDVGASAGAFGCAGALVWHVSSRWRRPAGLALALYLGIMLVASHRIWDVEHAIAALIGFGLGAWLCRGWAAMPNRRPFHALRPTSRLVIATLVTVVGALNTLASLGIDRAGHFAAWRHDVPFVVMHGTRTYIALAGIFLILLAHGLLHGRRTAWLATICLLAGSCASHLIRGYDLDRAIAPLVLIILLIWRQRDFRARPDVLTVTRGVGFALLALGLLAVYIPLGFATMRTHFTEPLSFGLALREALTRMAFTTTHDFAGRTQHARWFLDSITWMWAGVVGYSVIVILRPVLRPTVDTPRDRQRAWELLRRYGATTTAYMTTWPGNTILLNGERDAYIAYRLIGGVALTLGDPIGSDEGCRRAIDEFIDLAAVNGWTPCIYGAGERFLPTYAEHGLAALPVGEDTIVDLATLEFKGKRWQDVRTALNRAKRESISFQMIDQASADPALTRQLWQISEGWTQEKKLPEMDFTLGKLTDPPDPEIRTAVAIDGSGRVHGFATWLPVYAGNGKVIDMMRRREDAFRGVMEFLIAESARTFKAEGVSFISLAAAPLARVSREGEGEDEAGVLERALTIVAGWADTFYHFNSLYDFKRKFLPRWEPLYLIYPGPTSLPRIGYAILRAYLPGLGLDDVPALLAGAVEVVPRPRSRPWRTAPAPVTEQPVPAGGHTHPDEGDGTGDDYQEPA